MIPPESQLESLVAEANALIDVGKFDAALTRARDAAAIDPNDPRPYIAWSRALIGKEDNVEAATLAERAVSVSPNNPAAHLIRADALRNAARASTGDQRMSLGREAVASAREAVRLSPNVPTGYLALSQSLPLIEAHLEADRVIQQLIRLAPDWPPTWVAASNVAIHAKNFDAAITASRKALSISPNNQAALNNLGIALRATGKHREGTHVLAQAVRLNPNSSVARSNLSNAGINVVRIAILVILIPISVLLHLGLLLFFLFAIGSNVLISKDKKLALRLERWTAPVALRFAKLHRGPSKGATLERQSSHQLSDIDWSAQRRQPRVRRSVRLLGEACLWFVAILLLINTVTPSDPNRVDTGVALTAFVLAALWLRVRDLRRAQRH